MNVTDVPRMTMDISRTIPVYSRISVAVYINRSLLSLIIQLIINVIKPIKSSQSKLVTESETNRRRKKRSQDYKIPEIKPEVVEFTKEATRISRIFSNLFGSQTNTFELFRIFLNHVNSTKTSPNFLEFFRIFTNLSKSHIIPARMARNPQKNFY